MICSWKHFGCSKALSSIPSFTMATSKLEALNAFIKFQHPNITFIPPTSPSYIEYRATFIIDEKKTPLAIVRPQTAQDVAALISFSTANKIKFVIRSGGNNLYGLSCEHDAIMMMYEVFPTSRLMRRSPVPRSVEEYRS